MFAGIERTRQIDNDDAGFPSHDGVFTLDDQRRVFIDSIAQRFTTGVDCGYQATDPPARNEVLIDHPPWKETEPFTQRQARDIRVIDDSVAQGLVGRPPQDHVPGHHCRTRARPCHQSARGVHRPDGFEQRCLRVILYKRAHDSRLVAARKEHPTAGTDQIDKVLITGGTPLLPEQRDQLRGEAVSDEAVHGLGPDLLRDLGCYRYHRNSSAAQRPDRIEYGGIVCFQSAAHNGQATRLGWNFS